MRQEIKNFWWDAKKQSVRGSFVLFVITMVILILICIGAVNSYVADNLKKMELLIGTVFGFSISAWSYRKIKEKCEDKD